MTAAEPGPPEVAEAAQSLAEAAAVEVASRSMVRNAALARPLLAWGSAWLAAAAAWTWLPSPWGTLVGLICCLAAGVVSWMVRDRTVRRGAESEVRRSWFALLAASPLLLLVVSPLPATGAVIFLAALWGVGLALLGLGTSDIPLVVVGAVVVVTAAVARSMLPGYGVLVVGVVGGLAMTGVGWRRLTALR